MGSILALLRSHERERVDAARPLAGARGYLHSLALAATLLAAAAPSFAAERFSFAALGCLPYARTADGAASFERLIAEINRAGPAFTVHLGDIFSSAERATDELYRTRLADFNTFNAALVYTPGDNEWTDTHSANAGGYDPLERLAKLRQVFFAEERSLGRKPIPLVTQRRDAKFAAFVENARWSREGVVFATIHVTGSSNNRRTGVESAMAEWRARDEANAAWIRATFAEAKNANAPGVALFFQANPFAADKGRAGYDAGFEVVLKAIETESRAYAKPVLLVHADEHRYRNDRAIRFAAESEPVPNVSRLETFGDQNVHAVLVTVDPESPDVFLTGPLIVPGNARPVLPKPKKAK